MSRVLVTGAAGFIGRHLVDRLAARHEVVAVVRPGAAPMQGVETLHHDLATGAPPAERLGDLDAVVHLAQATGDAARDPVALSALHCQATSALLQAAVDAGADAFVLASTGTVYAPDGDWAREDEPPAPVGHYGSSKAAGELLAAAWDDLRVVRLRPFTVYGPGQVGRLVPTVLERVRTGRPITVDGPAGGFRTNPTFVTDAARAFAAAVEKPVSGAFNVGGDEAVTIEELARRVGGLLGVEPVFERRPDGRPFTTCGANDRMKDELGVTPVGLDEGLRRTLDAHQGSA